MSTPTIPAGDQRTVRWAAVVYDSDTGDRLDPDDEGITVEAALADPGDTPSSGDYETASWESDFTAEIAAGDGATLYDGVGLKDFYHRITRDATVISQKVGVIEFE